jgi:hypothetical protein
MKAEDFNKNYSIDTKARRGVKAVSKTAGGYPETLTADNVPFNSENQYFFFDTSTGNVRESIGLRRVDAEWLGGFGLRIIEIEKLRGLKSDALGDGQAHFKGEIQKLQEKIADFETEKTN